MRQNYVRVGIKQMFSNPYLLFFMAGIDAAFFLLMYMMRGLLFSFDQFFYRLREQTAYWPWLGAYLAGAILVLGIITALYSFFKHHILWILENGAAGIFSKYPSLLKGVFPFIIFNLKLMVPLLFAYFFILVNLMGMLRVKSNQAQDPIMLLLVFLGASLSAIIASLIAYAAVNIAHFAYLKEKEHPARVFFMAIKKGSLGFLWQDLKIILGLGGALLLIHLFAKNVIFGNYLFYVKNYWIYQRFVWGYAIAGVYFLGLFNRMYWQRKIGKGIIGNDRF